MRIEQKKKNKYVSLTAFVCAALLLLCGCSVKKQSAAAMPAKEAPAVTAVPTGEAVTFAHHLDTYQPQKKTYRLYFTYKLVHPWWDAVALGIEDAVEQYAARGITVEYSYVAPKNVSAADQIERIRAAAARQIDVIGVDVADIEALTPVINELIEGGQKVMTFSSSDAPAEAGCKRIAYVGNTHNYQDGAALTEALCEKLEYRGKVAVLVGSKGAPCHEDRARAAMDVLAGYPDMKIVAVEYDDDSIDKAYTLAEAFIRENPDLAGIICCNMSNPVGAARAVLAAGKENSITIVGMDHDIEALRYLRDGVIYALGVQDCYAIGFDTICTALKLADGVYPSASTYPEKTEEKTTVIFREGASDMLSVLYGVSE